MYDFDIRNLDKIKILSQSDIELKSAIFSVTQDTNRFLENDISPNSRISASLMTGKKFK